VADNGKLERTSRQDGDLILLVEDDEDSRFVYRLLFEDQGFKVLLAASGEEGLRLAREAKPQAIIMDVSIPGVDGWTATQRLKSDPQMADIPVIVLTAHAFPEDRVRARAVGCNAFLTKPCEPREVLEEVRRQLAGPGRPA
jgi:two-component system, cell cycle response regulator DivK